MKKTVIAAIAFAAALAAQALESSIAYQGILRDDQGAVLSGSQYTISFRLYTQASGGTPLWGRSTVVILDANGLFNVELADSVGSDVGGTLCTSLAEALARSRGGSLYVGLTVSNSSGEISPRQKIMSVPYATYAADVSRAGGDFAVAGKTTLGDAEAQTLDVSGNIGVGGSAMFSQNLTVNGNLSVSSPSAISGRGAVPFGAIVIWSGSLNNIPSGWSLCNGSNGTPDLRERFVLGTTTDVGGRGGASDVTLTVSNIPPHTHNYFGDDQLEGRDSKYGTTTKVESMGGYDADSTQKGSSKIYRTSATGGSNGSTKSFSILPPYYKLAYIMRVH